MKNEMPEFLSVEQQLRQIALQTAFNLASRQLEKTNMRPGSDEIVANARRFLDFLLWSPVSPDPRGGVMRYEVIV